MIRERKLSVLVLEGVFYGISGIIFIVLIFVIQDYFTRNSSSDTGFPVYGIGEINIGLIWAFLGLSLSAISGNILFRKATKYVFLKWFFILITFSITSILMQMTFLVYRSDMTINKIISIYIPEHFQTLIGLHLMIKLFIILTPFTILFANRRLLIEGIQNRNALR